MDIFYHTHPLLLQKCSFSCMFLRSIISLFFFSLVLLIILHLLLSKEWCPQNPDFCVPSLVFSLIPSTKWYCLRTLSLGYPKYILFSLFLPLCIWYSLCGNVAVTLSIFPCLPLLFCHCLSRLPFPTPTIPFQLFFLLTQTSFKWVKWAPHPESQPSSYPLLLSPTPSTHAFIITCPLSARPLQWLNKN